MRYFFLAVLVFGGLAVSCASSTELGPDGTVILESEQIVQPPEMTGDLEPMGTLVLRSPYGHFGGLSGLDWDGEDRFVAVTDRGQGVRFRLREDAAGTLAGVADGRMVKMSGAEAWPMTDAEEIRLTSAGALVAFEREHRLWRYRRDLGGSPDPVALPADVRQLPRNGGIEAIAALHDGRLLLIAEAEKAPAWIGTGEDGWRRLTYVAAPGFKPTSAATLPDGNVVVLERRYIAPLDWEARLVRVEVARLTAGARIEGVEIARLLTGVDNMEGIAIRRAPDGDAWLYLVSDDNFVLLQRTLVMKFRYRRK